MRVFLAETLRTSARWRTGRLGSNSPIPVAARVGAALMFSAAFLQATRDARHRRLAHISGGAGSSAYGGWSVYCAKAALDHHARAALDHTQHLHISSVAPGVIDTEMQAEIPAAIDADFPDRQRFVELKREGLRSPEQAGRDLVEFMLSDRFGKDLGADLQKRLRINSWLAHED